MHTTINYEYVYLLHSFFHHFIAFIQNKYTRLAQNMFRKTIIFIVSLAVFKVHFSKSNDAGPVTFERLGLQIEKFSKYFIKWKVILIIMLFVRKILMIVISFLVIYCASVLKMHSNGTTFYQSFKINFFSLRLEWIFET